MLPHRPPPENHPRPLPLRPQTAEADRIPRQQEDGRVLRGGRFDGKYG